MERRALSPSTLLLSLGLAPALLAEGAGGGTLRGTVVDAAGGVLPGAVVTLVNARTRVVRITATSDSGSSVFPSVHPGDYRVEVSLTGFRTWQGREVHLSPGDSQEVEARLEVGGRAEAMEVTAGGPTLRGDQGAREGVITPQQIQSLSIMGRGAMELLKILPGTVTPDPSELETVGFINGLAWFGTDGHAGYDRTVSSGAITPVFTADPRMGGDGVGDRVLDLDRIRIPAFGETGPLQQPYDFRYPGCWNFDVSLFKRFALGARGGCGFGRASSTSSTRRYPRPPGTTSTSTSARNATCASTAGPPGPEGPWTASATRHRASTSPTSGVRASAGSSRSTATA